MHSWDFPGTLSPCLRTFLEMLCNEASVLPPMESRMLVPFALAAEQPQQQTSAVELK